MPVGQAPVCYNLPKDVSFKITGAQVVFRRCTSTLEADGSFRCSIVPLANAVLEWAGHIVAGNAVEGTLSLQVTIPPPAVEKGNSCHGTFKASRQ